MRKKRMQAASVMLAIFVTLAAGACGREGQQTEVKAQTEETSETEASEEDAAELAALAEKEEKARQEQEEREQKAREKAERREKRQEYLAEAQEIADGLTAVDMDALLCEDSGAAADIAAQVREDCKSFRKSCRDEEKSLTKPALKLIRKTNKKAKAIIEMSSIDESIGELYDRNSGQVAMLTDKNEELFADLQQRIWQLPDSYPEKEKQYDTFIGAVSEAWNYVNDDTHYQSSTLSVSVEELKTDYTKYWIVHVETFSTAQMCSALCGGTYGSPRKAVSEEVTAHGGVIGINGSGFDYNSCLPAPGKSMIKDGEIYNDVYSNGNIMCVTWDGGMFTAVAGMTTEDMLTAGVRDTYCFGPTLVEDGQACEISSQFNQTYRYQRTAVGMVNPGNYYLLVVDGKGAGGSQGMTYEEMQQVFLDLGCEYAYNMDGGGSSTLVFKGKVLNTLTDAGQERPVADVLYFIDVGDGGEGDDIMIYEDEAMLKPPSS